MATDPNPPTTHSRELVCARCGKRFTRKFSKHRRRAFCSPQCARAVLAVEGRVPPVDKTKPYQAHEDSFRDTWGPYRTPRELIPPRRGWV